MQLDWLGTALGAIAGISGILLSNGVGNAKVVGTVGGIAGVCLGIITQRPATSTPTTEQVEDKEVGNG